MTHHQERRIAKQLPGVGRLAIFLACLAGLVTLKWILAAAETPVRPRTTVRDPRTSTHRPVPLRARDQRNSPKSEPLVAPIRIPGLPPQVSDVPTGSWNGHGLLPIFHDGEFVHDDQALFHAHGPQVCASGCAASRHPTQQLTKSAFHDLMSESAAGPLDETNRAFETLLFFGRQTRLLLESEGYAPLAREQARTLWRELSRTHARISIRVVDENQAVRSSLKPTRVPFDRRHVFEMATVNLQPLVTSGTVKRVGLHHLWTRL